LDSLKKTIQRHWTLTAISIVAITVLAIWLLWFAIGSWIGGRVDKELIEKAGLVGDSFGSLNALFAAIGFIMLLFSLRQQQRQITRAEREQSRQRFESSFFEILRLLRELRKEIHFSYSRSYRTREGKQASEAEYTDHKAVLAIVRELSFQIETNPESKWSREKLASIYDKNVHSRYEGFLSPYFRIIYTMLIRIRDSKDLEEDERFTYSRLLRSQLTTPELTILAFNSMSPVSKDFSHLVTHFRMLKYMPESKIKEIFKGVLHPHAFLSRDDGVASADSPEGYSIIPVQKEDRSRK